ncbi:MAG: tetratricopeptide repeat protein [Planctomycetes bacterium]|nr:tetratricopeptide repeat protein [Planctomycetota bacterium]
MPPHEGHDHGPDGDEGFGPDADGLPVHSRLIRPGAVATGCGIAALFAIVAQFRSIFAGLIWDDRVFLTDDPRVRSLSSVWRSFGEAFFTPDHPTEMYRPLVNASLAIDWFVSGSTPGAPASGWFHFVNVLLHAANSALVYLLFVNLTKRKLGAPLIAAVLFAVHPLAVEPTAWIVGRCDLLAALCGLTSSVLLLRSSANRRLLWWAVAAWGLGLFAKASIATLPVVVAAGLMAYHEVEPKRLLGARLRNRFLLFAVPAAVWVGARVAVFGGWPFPQAGGRVWHDVALGDAIQGVGRAVFVQTAHVFLPVGLSGDYAADVAFTPGAAPWDLSSVLGLAILAGMTIGGIRLLRRHSAGFPMLAYVLTLIPVLQIVPIGAIFADRFQYVPMMFLLLLVAEGLESLYYRWGALRGLAPTLLVFAALPVMSHLRAKVWRDDVTFQRDVLVSYPHASDSRYRLALALSGTGRAEDRVEATGMLRAEIETSPRPDDELALLGALLLEDGDLAAAESMLRRAVEAAGGKPRLGAQTRYNLAVCLKRAGRADECRPLLEEALRRAPDLTAARALLDSLR